MQPSFSHQSSKIPRSTKTTTLQKPAQSSLLGAPIKSSAPQINSTTFNPSSTQSSFQRTQSPFEANQRPLFLKQHFSATNVPASGSIQSNQRMTNLNSNRLVQERIPVYPTNNRVPVAENYDTNEEFDDCDELVPISRQQQRQSVGRPPNSSQEISNVFNRTTNKQTTQSATVLRIENRKTEFMPPSTIKITQELKPLTQSYRQQPNQGVAQSQPLSIADLQNEHQFFAGSFAALDLQKKASQQSQVKIGSKNFVLPQQSQGLIQSNAPRQDMGPQNFKMIDRTPPLLPQQLDFNNQRSLTNFGQFLKQPVQTQQDEGIVLETQYDDQIDEMPQDTVYDQDQFDEQSNVHENIQDEVIANEAFDMKSQLSATRSAAGRKILPNSLVQMHRDERMQAVSPLRQVFNHLLSHSPRGSSFAGAQQPSNTQFTKPAINPSARAQANVQNIPGRELQRSKSRTSQVSNQPTPSISDQRAQKILNNETVEDNVDPGFFSNEGFDVQLRMAQSRLEAQLNAKKQLLHQKMLGVASRPQMIEVKNVPLAKTEQSPFIREERQLIDQLGVEFPETAKDLNRSNTLLSQKTNLTLRTKNHEDGLGQSSIIGETHYSKTQTINKNSVVKRDQRDQLEQLEQENERQKKEELKREYLALLAFQNNLNKQKSYQLEKHKSHAERIRSRSPSVDILAQNRIQQRKQLANESFGRAGDIQADEESQIVTLNRRTRQNLPESLSMLPQESQVQHNQSNNQTVEHQGIKMKLSRSPVSPRTNLVIPDYGTYEGRTIDAAKMKNSRTFVANFAAGELEKQTTNKPSEYLDMRSSRSRRQKLRSDMQPETSSMHGRVPNSKGQEQSSLQAYAIKAKGSVTQMASPNRSIDKRSKRTHKQIDIFDQQAASGITSPRIIVQQSIRDQKTRNRIPKGSVGSKTSSVQQSFVSEQIRLAKTNQHSTQKQPLKHQKEDFLSRSNSAASQESAQQEEIELSSSGNQSLSGVEYGSQEYGSENHTGSEEDYMADDQSETVNHRKIRGTEKQYGNKKQQLSESDSDQPKRAIFSGDERHRQRNKHIKSYNADFQPSASRKTPHAKQKMSQRRKRLVEEEELYDSEETTPRKSQKSRRHQTTKAKKTEKNKNYEITAHSNHGFRNNGLKININMKGLDKNSLSSEKTYPQEYDIQSKLQMMYGNMIPNLDPLAFGLPQYGANPNLAAAMHLQSQLNLMTMQQQSMLRMQGVNGSFGQFSQQISLPKEPELSTKTEPSQKPEPKINWIFKEEDRSPSVPEESPPPNLRELPKQHMEIRPVEEEIVLIEPDHLYAANCAPTAVFDEPSFAQDNENFEFQEKAQQVTQVVRVVEQPENKLIIEQIKEPFIENVKVQIEDQPALETKRNTALVICFDNDADQEALRNPFKKKPKLRSKMPTPGAKTLAQEEPLPKPQEKLSERKPQTDALERKPIDKDAMRIEIFFDEPIKPTAAPSTIAEAFLQKRKQAASVIVDQDSAAMSQQAKEASSVRKTKTKEELFELRKQMMKKRKTATSAQGNDPGFHPQFENPYGMSLLTESPNYGAHLFTQSTANKKDNINYALMHRLAAGTKVKVDKQEMKKLTKKNYEALPENKKKRDEEKKRQEAAERQAKINQYKRELDERRKANLKKKQKGSVIESYDQGSTLSKGDFSDRIAETQRSPNLAFEEYKVITDMKSARR